MMILTLLHLAGATSPLHEGDIVFQRSRSEQSTMIAMATGSSWTHTGIIRLIEGEPWVLEAVQPVKLTPFSRWKQRAVEGQIAVRRVSEPVWTEDALHKLDILQERWLGRPYDLRFEPGTDALYCSELVREAYLQAAGLELVSLRPVDSYSVSDPQLRAAMIQRWGRIPSELLVVAPSDLFTAPGVVSIP